MIEVQITVEGYDYAFTVIEHDRQEISPPQPDSITRYAEKAIARACAAQRQRTDDDALAERRAD